MIRKIKVKVIYMNLVIKWLKEERGFQMEDLHLQIQNKI